MVYCERGTTNKKGGGYLLAGGRGASLKISSDLPVGRPSFLRMYRINDQFFIEGFPYDSLWQLLTTFDNFWQLWQLLTTYTCTLCKLSSSQDLVVGLLCWHPEPENSLCRLCRPTFDYMKQQEYAQKCVSFSVTSNQSWDINIMIIFLCAFYSIV